MKKALKLYASGPGLFW